MTGPEDDTKDPFIVVALPRSRIVAILLELEGKPEAERTPSEQHLLLNMKEAMQRDTTQTLREIFGVAQDDTGEFDD